ncbi:MAG: hypothetical protein IPH26_11475 [Sterolibacteriaceae bacterium]|uniref:Transposase n=1 Tax=Candidatus Methylophosphatis roskildensis TaxID=2899263 RepID=A0A9D7HKX7_9PROT|nr:hypothetical protein [Candidatus Methylophosphatis roskildensis]MBK7236645.1 hypothetical protein [Sterolibacteriaceae bacterium]
MIKSVVRIALRRTHMQRQDRQWLARLAQRLARLGAACFSAMQRIGGRGG